MEKGLAIASETLSQAKLAAKTDIENVPQTSGEATESQQGMWHIDMSERFSLFWQGCGISLGCPTYGLSRPSSDFTRAPKP